MSKIFITLDYEIFFGSKAGTIEKCLIEPVLILNKILDKYGVKATFFVDAGYLYNLTFFSNKNSDIKQKLEVLKENILFLSNNGHDIQLHIHPHWEDCFYVDNDLYLNTKRFKLHDFSQNDIDKIIYKYKKVLYDIVNKPIIAYRAGGWCIQPFNKIRKALIKNKILIDSTLFNNGRAFSKTHYFNFKNMPLKTYYRFNSDPLSEDINGDFIEIPISSTSVSPLFNICLFLHKIIGGEMYKAYGDGKAIPQSFDDKIRMVISYTSSVVSADGYKAKLIDVSFKKFTEKYNSVDDNFVIIGHPKAFSQYSMNKLESFVRKNYKIHKFTTFSEEYLDYI